MQVRIDAQSSGIRAENHDAFDGLLNLRPCKAEFGSRNRRELIQNLYANHPAIE
jgi:hypothetical protein